MKLFIKIAALAIVVVSHLEGMKIENREREIDNLQEKTKQKKLEEQKELKRHYTEEEQKELDELAKKKGTMEGFLNYHKRKIEIERQTLAERIIASKQEEAARIKQEEEIREENEKKLQEAKKKLQEMEEKLKKARYTREEEERTLQEMLRKLDLLHKEKEELLERAKQKAQDLRLEYLMKFNELPQQELRTQQNKNEPILKLDYNQRPINQFNEPPVNPQNEMPRINKPNEMPRINKPNEMPRVNEEKTSFFSRITNKTSHFFNDYKKRIIGGLAVIGAGLAYYLWTKPTKTHGPQKN